MPALGQKSDVELLLDYSRSKSHAAFEALVQRHGSMVHGVARRVLSNHHDAEDVTQATFLVLARQAPKMSKVNSLAGWLHTVARRMALNALKSRTLREAREQAAMKEETSTGTPSAELQAEFCRELDASIARLPERYRHPLVLFHLEGASIEETAQILNLEPSTLRTRLGRARAMLRDALVRRGVKVASMGMLAGMLSADGKAAAIGASGARHITEAVLGNGVLGASVQSLASELGAAHAISGSSLSTSIFVIMKTKASIIAAAVVAAAALFTAVRVVAPRQEAGPEVREGHFLAEHRSVSPRAMHSQTSRGSLSSSISDGGALGEITSTKQLDHLIASVFMIPDEQERLRAIRERLGMNVSDEVYHRALEECRYDLNPKRHHGILCEKWTQADGEAAVQWVRQIPENTGSGIEHWVFWLWLAQDEDAALAWGRKNLDPELLEESRRGANSHGKPYMMPADQIAGYLETLHTQESLPANELFRPKRDLDDVAGVTLQIADITLGVAIGTLGYKNPEMTLEFIISSGVIDEHKYRRDISDFFKGWAGRDPDAAIAAASEHLEGDHRNMAILEALECWQIKYPHRSLEEAVDLNEFSEKQRQRLRLSSAKVQARLNPELALQRAMQVQSQKMAEKELQVVINVWSCLAEDDAMEWVSTMPEGKQKDMSLDGLARAVSSYDLEGVAGLVSQISDKNRRDKAVREILTRYRAGDGDLEACMRMADVSHTIPVIEVYGFMSSATDAEECAIIIDWLRERRAQGRIKNDDFEQAGKIIRILEERQKSLQ